MKIDHDTYYYLIYDAGIQLIFRKLYELDKFPALRYMLLMEKIHCGGLDVKNYSKADKLDELKYSKDMLSGIYDDLFYDRLKVNPDTEYEFFEIMIKIEAQKCNYIKNNDHFDLESKISLLKYTLKAIKIRRLLDRKYIEFSNELVNFLNGSIPELEESRINENADFNSGNLNGSQKENESNSLTKKEPAFEFFFIDQEMIQPLLKFLTKENVISASGKWMGKKKRKTDLMGFIDALQAMDLIEFKNQTEVGSAFYKRFNLNINIRSVTLPTGIRDDACEIYQELLDDFLLDYNQKKQLEIAK